MILGTISQIINTAGTSLQKQYEKNPTATVITGLALGALGVVTLARQVNCPPKIPPMICAEVALPDGSRGRYNEDNGFIYVYPSTFKILSLSWTLDGTGLWNNRNSTNN